MLKTIFSRAFTQCIWAITLSVGLSTPLSAQPAKISGPLVPAGDVGTSAFSPDGLYAVYAADKDTNGVNELYSVRLSTGVITKISGSLVAGGNVIYNGFQVSFQISPDSTRVVFVADKDTVGVTELYSTPIASNSSEPIKISGALVAGGDVVNVSFLGFQISPDSARVVFRADKDVDGVDELYSTPIASNSSEPIKLCGPLTIGGNVSDFEISPDSARVVFRADKNTDDVFELYSTPINSGAVTKISGTLVAGGDVGFFRISPDSTRVVIQADKDTAGVLELYSTPISSNTSEPIKISGSLVAGGTVFFLRISPDGTRVVFTADKDTNDVVELYSTPIANNSPIKISGAMVAGGNVAYYLISPDSARVVFLANKDTNGTDELYSTPIAASAPIKISGTLVAGGDAGTSFQISPDSARVVFIADKDTVGVKEIYRVPIANNGSTPNKISGSLVAGGGVISSQISPDGARVAFIADKDTDERFELYLVQIGGTALALDFDGDDLVLPDTDALLLARYKAGYRGAALIANAIGVNATVSNPNVIRSRIRAALGVGLP